MSVENLTDFLKKLKIDNKPSTGSQILSENQLTVESISKNIKNLEKQISNEINEFTMSRFSPEYLKCVPDFDGNPNDLNRYISICDALINEFYDQNNTASFQNVYLLNSLISKLSGNAKLVVNIQSVNTWQDVRNTLTRNFADQRDETCLNRDLVMLRQNLNEKPQQFYDRVLNILNLLCAYVDLHETTDANKKLKRTLYQNLALKTFLSGLREPLGTTIRCMKPIDLSEALQIVLQEDNVHYFQNSNNKILTRPGFSQIRPDQTQKIVRSTPINFNANTQNDFFRSQQNRFPSRPINIQPRINNQPQKFFTNSQVFRQPQQNQNQKINVFKPNQNKILPKPTPMSVCTQNTNFANRPSTSYQSTNFANRPSTSYQPPQQRNWVAEELFYTQTDEYQPETTYYDLPQQDYGHTPQQYYDPNIQYTNDDQTNQYFVVYPENDQINNDKDEVNQNQNFQVAHTERDQT